MVTIDDIRKVGQPKAKLDEDFLESRLTRLFTPYISKICIEKGITANQISIISLFSAGLGSFFLSYNKPQLMIVSVFLYIVVFNTLDNVDGEIARVTGVFTKLGAKLEDISEPFMYSTSFLFLGLGLFNRTHGFIILYLGFFFAITEWILFYQAIIIRRIILKNQAELSNGKNNITRGMRENTPNISYLWNLYRNFIDVFKFNRIGFLLIILVDFYYPIEFVYFAFQDVIVSPLILYLIIRGLSRVLEIPVMYLRTGVARSL